jgi:WD40 repeat protein
MEQIHLWKGILLLVALAITLSGCGGSTPESTPTGETITPTATTGTTASDTAHTPLITPSNSTHEPAPASQSGKPSPGIPAIDQGPMVIGSGNFNGHREAVVMRSAGLRFLQVSPDGRFVTTVRQVNRTGALLQVREISSGQVKHELYEPLGITALTFEPNSQSLAYGAGDLSIVLKSLDARPASRWPAHLLTIGDIAFSPDGRWLASFGDDNRLIVWDAAHARAVAQASDSTARFAQQVRFFTAERLWTRSNDGIVRWYDFTGDQLNPSQEVKLPDDFIVSATDGGKLYGTSPGRSLRIVDAASGRDLPVPQSADVAAEQREQSIQRLVMAVASRSHDVAMITSGTQLTLWREGAPSQSWDPEAAGISLVSSDQDGRVWVAYSGSEGLLVLDRDRPESIRRIDPDEQTVSVSNVAPCFSPDGTIIASFLNANTLALSEIQTGLTRRRISRPAALLGTELALATVLLIGHRNEVFCGTSDGHIEFWSAEPQTPLSTVSVSKNAVTALTTTSDGNYLIAGDASGVTTWVDLRTSTVFKTSREQNDKITATDVSSDGRFAATASKDRTVVLTNVARQSPLLTLRDFPHTVQAVRFSNSGDLMACGDERGTVSIWSIPSGKQVWSTSIRDALSRAQMTSQAQTSSQPPTTARSFASLLASAFLPGNAVPDSGIELPTGIVRVAFSPDDRVLAIGTASGYTQTIDLVHQRLLAPVYHEMPIGDLKFSADAASLLVATSTGDVFRRWRAPDQPSSLSGHEGSVRFVALDSSGQRAVTGGVDGQLNVWSVDQSKLIQSIDNEGEAITAGALSPDGRGAVSSGYGSGVAFWDLAELKRIGKRYGHKARVWSFAFSPDGTQVASGGDDQTVKIWDFATQKILSTIDQGAPVRYVRFSADAKYLLTCTIDPKGWQYPAQLRLWETATGKPLVEYKGHRVAVNAAVFSNDGQEMTSCGADGQVYRWDVLSGKRIDEWSRPFGLSHAGLIRGNKCLVMRRFNDGFFIDSAESKTLLSEVDVPTLAITDMNVASDGDRIIVGTEEGVAYVWSISHE